MELRSELGRQMGAVHERIDDMSQRLEDIVRLLAPPGHNVGLVICRQSINSD